MMTRFNRNSILGAVAVGGLAAYVLACASFSPDDSKVAFPAFDAETGGLGVGVLDRKSGKTEQVFTLMAINNPTDPDYEARLLQPGWLDNKRLVVVWPEDTSGSSAEVLLATVVPLGGAGPLRQWRISGVEDADEKYLGAVATAGSKLLVAMGSNLVGRLDLDNGGFEARLLRGDEVSLYPAGSQNHVFYLSRAEEDGGFEMGRLDAKTFAQTVVMSKVEMDPADATIPAFSRDGKTMIAITEKQGATALKLFRAGQPPREVPVTTDLTDLKLLNVCLSPQADVAYASFCAAQKGQTNHCLGLLETPLDGRPAASTIILPRFNGKKTEEARYFNIVPSGDGKTIAVSTTYLCADLDAVGLRPEDCALYLVDLTRKPHPITKARLPGPMAGRPLK